MTTSSEYTTSELITLPPADTSEVNLPSIPAHFTAPALEAFYKQVEAEVTAEVPDVETPEGRANIKALAAKVASSKTAIDKPIRDHLRAIKAIPKILEANARESIERFDNLKATVLAPLEAAQSPQDAILAMLAGIPTRCASEFTTSDSVRPALAEVESVNLYDFWPELRKKARATSETALTMLRDTLERLEREEATAAELERLRQEAAIREQQERDRLIAEEAARKAREEEEARARRDREDAERRAAEARQREEQAKLDAQMAEQRAAEAEQRLAEQQAAQAERDRIAEEDRQAEMARKAREDDKAHRTAINRAALNALMAETGIDVEMGKKVLTAIGTGLVPNCRIHY